MLYLNAHQWGFQFPLVLKMAKAGYPIRGITIGAGVPSTEKATEIFEQMIQSHIYIIGFKPGSVSAIFSVLELASHAPPPMKIMLQWTSGRGGGCFLSLF
jgi:enoyl reductase-like protein